MIDKQLAHLAATRPDAVFVRWEDRRISFGEMEHLVAAFARRLDGVGIGEGDHVVVICQNRPAFLIAWFGLTRIGAVTVPLNTALVGQSLRYSLSQSDAVAILVEEDLIPAIHRELAEQEGTPPIHAIGAADEDVAVGEPPRGPFRHLAPPDRTAVILYTSGTTGLPKGAMIPHGSYSAAGRDMARALGLTCDDRIMVFLPLFHANPQMYAVASALEVGASLILLRKFVATELFDAARAHGATGFTYVGTVLALLDKRVPEPDRAHALRFCVGGGAPLKVWQAIEQRFGVPVRELYGMTETGGWVSMNTADASRLGSVGSARPGVRIAIMDDRRQPLPTGCKGEIAVCADDPRMFFSGYWRKPEATAETLRDGWLYTGDRGWLDEDGFLHFDGRIKELIRRAGEMISPAEIELQLLSHPSVRDCAVVGVEDEVFGEEIKAVVVTGEPVEAAALHGFLSGRLPAYMLPRYFVFVDVIPKTETQKIKRHELAGHDPAGFDMRQRTKG